MLKNAPEKRHEQILESKTDATEWKLEVERVLPQLKVTIKMDHKVQYDDDDDDDDTYTYFITCIRLRSIVCDVNRCRLCNVYMYIYTNTFVSNEGVTSRCYIHFRKKCPLVGNVNFNFKLLI